MKKAAGIILLIMMLGTTAEAVDPQVLAQMRLVKLERKLNLSPDQIAEVKVMLANHINEMSGKPEPGSTDPRQRKEQDRSSDSLVREQLGAVLDGEQMEKLSNLRGRILPDPRLIELNSRLDLTEEQVRQINSVITEGKPKRGQQSEPGADTKKETPELRKQRAEKQDAAIEEVLSEEQKEIFAAMKKERKDRGRKPRPPKPDSQKP